MYSHVHLGDFFNLNSVMLKKYFFKLKNSLKIANL